MMYKENSHLFCHQRPNDESQALALLETSALKTLWGTLIYIIN